MPKHNEFLCRLAIKNMNDANKKILELGLKQENIPALKKLFKDYYNANKMLKKYS